MKIQKIVVCVMLTFSFNNSFGDLIRTTTNGGRHGYKETVKTVDGTLTTIDCKDPGYDVCPENSVVPDEQPLIGHAISAIRDGVLSGTYSSGPYTVTWTSDNTEMRNSRIEVR